MYWPIKALFGLVVIAALGAGVYFTWPYLPIGKGGSETAETAEAVDTADTGDSGNDALVAVNPKSTPTTPLAGKYATKLKIAAGMVEKDPVTARKLVENILKDPELVEYSDAWNQVALALTPANRAILFTDVPAPEKETYVIQPGNSLARIAKHYNTTFNLLAKAHRIDLQNPIVRPGQTLRIWKGYWNIKVSKSKYMLLLYDGERLVMAYRVGLGKQNRTPEGKFVVVSKMVKAPWNRDGKTVYFDDPEYPLGTRWMQLKGTEERTLTYEGYGIHGTKDPDSIGGNESNGCVRMVNGAVEELYDILPKRGTPVVLIP